MVFITWLAAECKIDCRKKPASKLVIKREMKPERFKEDSVIGNYSDQNGQNNFVFGSTTPPTSTDTTLNSTGNQTTLAPKVKNLIRYLHKRMLIKLLSYGFTNDQSGLESRPEFIPEQSFKVLEKLKDIAFKTCAGKVPRVFLEFGFVMFQVAYENRGTDLLEFLTEREENDITQFLNDCHDSIKPLNFNEEKSFCSDEVIINFNNVDPGNIKNYKLDPV